MTQFYIYSAALVVVALLFIVLPLIRAKKQQQVELSNANVIKQRINELEQEVEEGLIDPSEKEATIQELKLALVNETPDVFIDDSSSSNAVSAKLMFLLGLPALIIGAWVYYDANQISGLAEYKQTKVDVERIREKLQTDGGQSLTPNDFAKLALSIRSTLRDNPYDVQGWSYLALVNTSIGRVDEGIAAYEKALDLTPQDDALRFKYAETLMLSGSEDGLESAKRQLSFLIGKNPADRNYRLLMTTVAIQLQDADLALSNFDLIKGDLRPDSQFYQSLVAGLRGIGVDIQLTESNLANSAPDTASSEESSKGAEILISVNVSTELQSKIPENAYLVVFAQNGDGSSRAPLAVKRMALGQTPVRVSLSNNDAMIPAMNLSSVDVVNITARISKDEDVMPTKGDLEGTVENINVNNVQENILNLLIDKELN